MTHDCLAVLLGPLTDLHPYHNMPDSCMGLKILHIEKLSFKVWFKCTHNKLIAWGSVEEYVLLLYGLFDKIMVTCCAPKQRKELWLSSHFKVYMED